ncbi:chromatin binding [Pyrenophora seminiperda CCB06]|uniref:Chromatin binding n=1 Tax=Pyrenophora seminiperda CCB06 TaxID=1302712 RepID=A0A3M7MDS5_9PLEO|nr:chromatin binding [Pyrenophora seminiperda CCB06]
MSYLLGFSDKPFKGPSQSPAPPSRPKRPSQLTEMVTTPGGIIEWTASDGRKGRLTGTGKSRLTAATLAKIPSEKRSTHETLAAKSASKRSAPGQPANHADNPWDTVNWGNAEAKSGSKHSGSKKVNSNEGNVWDTYNWNTNDSKNQASGNTDHWTSGAFGNNWDMAAGGNDTDSKKNGTTEIPPATGPTVETALQEAAVIEADDSDSWTKGQDEKLMQMKSESATWADIANQCSKPLQECKKRFGEIKPKDWRPNKKGEAGGGGGGVSKKEKKKGKNKDANYAGKSTVQAPADIAELDCGLINGFGLGFDEATNDVANFGKKDNFGDTRANANASGGATGGADTSGGNAWEMGNSWGQQTGAGVTGGDAWGIVNSGGEQAGTGGNQVATGEAWNNTSKDNAVTTAWDDTTTPNWGPYNNQNNNPRDGTVHQGIVSINPPSPLQSRFPGKDENKTPEPTQPVQACPAMVELTPDGTFSADDLRLVARILQQDCSMVWNRISWRFKDKTGRTLHPDVFEKKITGYVEGKGSEKGKRRG